MTISEPNTTLVPDNQRFSEDYRFLVIYNRLRSASALYHSSHSTSDNSKLSKSNRAVNESESYTKLYQSLSPEKKTHFAHILTDINLKFMKNSNFPL